MSVLSEESQAQVETRLIEDGILTKADFAEIKANAKEAGTPLFVALVTSGRVTNEQLTKAIAFTSKLPYVNLLEARVEPQILELLPPDIAERYMAVPLGEMKNRLVVAMLDADNVQAVDFLSNRIGRPLKVYAASEEGIRQVLSQYKAHISGDLSKLNGDAANEADGTEPAGRAEDKKAINTLVQDSPISKALSTILEYAAKNRASDIHIEPLKEELKIRCRIDGILREIMKLPKSTEPPLVSRIKILSNLKIDEHRIPQDGEFTVVVEDKEIDLRISISPVVWGEQVVIRLLDKSGTSLKLQDMGYIGRSLRTIKAGLERTNGMILTSGPTGSGKSTSLYALLQEVKSDGINIVTLEDPVEYKMDGINQIQVNADIGLTFASGLRSILRQDPDVVMVGEIRDKETAELAVQASLTGHLVFSTLHTNSAAGILPRLLDMGIEPFRVATPLKGVQAQRLVRRLCSHCARPAAHVLPGIQAEAARWANLVLEGMPAQWREPVGCAHCQHTGYRGRVGIYELIPVDEVMHQAVVAGAGHQAMRAMARERGYRFLREDGLLKAWQGVTSVEEVLRVTAV